MDYIILKLLSIECIIKESLDNIVKFIYTTFTMQILYIKRKEI